jgi:hypothetical protein
MCFDQKSSFGFAACGLFAAWWIYSRTNNAELASGVFFYFTMEFLQGLQYFVIAPGLDSPLCDDKINQFLTILGYLHICLQPYFCHVINASLTKSPKYIHKYDIIKRLSLMGGTLLFCRFLYAPYGTTMDVSGESTMEWLRGEKLCTYSGKFHLAWSVPLADPTYYVPSLALHSFLMFAPFFALYEKKGMVIQGLFLFATGPGLAMFITPNLMEQASIWCFFSIAQICTMLFLIRETLIVNWGRETHRASLLASKPQLFKERSGKDAKKA